MDGWNAFTLSKDGTDVFATISPCCWMYEGYGLQFGLSLTKGACNAATVFVNEKQIKTMGLSREKLREVAEAAAVRWLAANGTEPLLKQQQQYTTDLAELRKELAAENAAEKKRLASERSRARKKGFTHCIEAVIHRDCGDDQFVRVYVVGEPDAKTIKAVLKRSVVKNDYRVSSL